MDCFPLDFFSTHHLTALIFNQKQSSIDLDRWSVLKPKFSSAVFGNAIKFHRGFENWATLFALLVAARLTKPR